MGRIIRLTERDLTNIVRRIVKEQTKQCPDPKNPNSFPGVRKIKAQQGLFNNLFKAGLVVDGKYGPKTSAFMKKYILSKGMTPVAGSKEWTGSSSGLIDDTFNGDSQKSDQLFNFMVQDGLKNFVPEVPEGCQKYRFDK